MRSSLVSMLIGILVIGGVVLGGFMLYKKFSVGADTLTESSCSKADINKDGKVNSLDLNSLIKAIGEGASGSSATKYDINSDDKVDNSDVNTLKSCWTASSATSSATSTPLL